MSASDGISPEVPPTDTGCVDCNAVGGWWLHLRRCAECGHIGCCDDSLSHHATEHFHKTGHPVIQSFEPDETWMFSYLTNDMVTGPELAPPRHHPLEQSTPGPAERVPSDWEQQLG